MTSELQIDQVGGVSVANVARTDVSDARLDFRWLATHRLEYLGKWVALRDGELLDADENVEALRARVHAMYGAPLLITKIRG